jgi:endonuclease YncB( thermonuclease family)
MLTSFSGRTRTLQLLAAILITLLLIVPGQFVHPAAAQVSGNSYTSPQFGFSMSWDDTWFVADETSNEIFDRVIVTNGLTYCTLLGGPDSSTTPQAALAGFIGAVRLSSGVSDMAPMHADSGELIRGGDDQHAFAAFTYTLTLDDGREILLATYIEARIIVPGESVVAFIAETPASAFDTQQPEFAKLLSTVRPGIDNPRSDPPLVDGEPAPVFVSGPWRVAVATTAVRPTFPDLGLRKKTDKAWLVAVLDVTNWSDQDAVLSARDFTIGTDPLQKPARIARSSMPAIADKLGTTPFAEDLTLEIAAGQTARVAVAFVIPAGAESPLLTVGSESLPLADVIASDLRADALPAASGPPNLTEGEIVSATDGNTLRVMLDGKERSSRIRLLGVNPPTDGSCFANAAESTLDDLAGATVLIESDPAITDGSVPSRYVWLVNDDGTRTLLNQRLIAEGSAYAAILPAGARFTAWFDATAKTADLADTGLWAGCASTEATASIGIATTPAAIPANREEATK